MLTPDKWLPGLRVSNGHEAYVLTKRQGGRWHGICRSLGREVEMVEDATLVAGGFTPDEFSALGRDPAEEPEGARAVRVTGQSHVGEVYTKRSPEKWWRDGESKDWGSPDHFPDRFAPLSPAVPQAEEEERYQCSVCTASWPSGPGTSPLCPCGPHKESDPFTCSDPRGENILVLLPTPAPLASQPCERYKPEDRHSCFDQWGSQPGSVDPCQPCAARIDAAEAVADRQAATVRWAEFDRLALNDASAHALLRAHRDRHLAPVFRPWWRR